MTHLSSQEGEPATSSDLAEASHQIDWLCEKLWEAVAIITTGVATDAVTKHHLADTAIWCAHQLLQECSSLR